MKIKVRWDENLGYWAGIVTVVIVGRCCMPWMGHFEILLGVMKGFIGW